MEAIGKFFIAILMSINPPGPNATEEHKRRWRVNVSATLGVLVMTVGGSIALALGFFPAFFPGFASAADVASVNETLRQVRVAQLESELFDAHVKACQAEKAGERDLAVVYELRVQEKLPAYQQLARQRYQLQPC